MRKNSKAISAALLLCMLAVIAGMVAKPDVVSVFSAAPPIKGGRKLPIYCVDTKENKVSISFDAAWGGGSYGL